MSFLVFPFGSALFILVLSVYALAFRLFWFKLRGLFLSFMLSKCQFFFFLFLSLLVYVLKKGLELNHVDKFGNEDLDEESARQVPTGSNPIHHK